MATTRGSAGSYSVGNRPPTVSWTIVRGDTSAFRVYVTDDENSHWLLLIGLLIWKLKDQTIQQMQEL